MVEVPVGKQYPLDISGPQRFAEIVSNGVEPGHNLPGTLTISAAGVDQRRRAGPQQ